MSNDIVVLPTGIDSLDRLFRGGIHVHSSLGLFGVIVGAAGTGKSVLSMELCTKFVLSKSESHSLRSAIYISQDPPQLVKAKIESAFNYFSPTELKKNERPALVLDPVSQTRKTDAPPSDEGPRSIADLSQYIDKKASIYICQLSLDAGSQKSVLANIIEIVAQTIRSFDESKESWDRILLCIDNVNAIDESALASVISGEWQHNRDSREDVVSGVQSGSPGRDALFCRRLREYCARHRINTFFVFEEAPHGTHDTNASTLSMTPEAYAADVVMWLGGHTHATGYRQRFIEIIKAKNQFYHRGRHHCSVVSRDSEKPGGLRGGGDRPSEIVPEVGLVVYPSVAAQLSWLQGDRKAQQGRAPKTGASAKNVPQRAKRRVGIDSLDRIIEDRLWQDAGQQAPRQRIPEGYILEGSSSVLVSDLDIKATEIGLHFALKSSRSLFISFLHEASDLETTARRFRVLREPQKSSDHVFKYFPPEHITEGKLLRDINLLIPKDANPHDNPFTIVIDNVFELDCKYPLLQSAKHFLSALLELFRVRGVTSFIIDTVEVGEARNPIEVSFAAGLVDNVFLLRHVEFQSRPHHVFSLLKLLGSQTPEMLWDLEEDISLDGSELVARKTFELYRNVLSGRPEPTTITLTVYMDAEGSSFHDYLLAYVKGLQESYGRDVVVAHMYGAEEYARTQDIITSARARQRPDCHIVHLDEFWLKQLIENQSLEELSGYIESADLPDEFKGRAQYVSAAHDIVMYKIAKDQTLRGKYGIKEEDRDSLGQWHKKRFAIPARNNCGILCCNPALVKEVMVGMSKDLGDRVTAWLGGQLEHKLEWGDLVSLKEQFDSKKHEQPGRYPQVFFTFCMDQMESCVCFLLELALSFGKRADLVENRKLRIENIPVEALQVLLSLLDHSDIQALASGVFRSSAHEPTALLSRQWMSTLGVLRSREGADAQDGYFSRLQLRELPWGHGKGHPTPVSGAWYLGILKGSIAIEVGTRVISQATSTADEVYKLNNFIGLPIREVFYRGKGGKDTPYPLPYRTRFAELAKIQRHFLDSPTKDKKYVKEILNSDYPFYRVLIDDYHLAAPVLWRLLVRVAREALSHSLTSVTQTKDIKDAIRAAVREHELLTQHIEKPRADDRSSTHNKAKPTKWKQTPPKTTRKP